MDKLITEDLVVGTGAAATAGQKVTVHYTGWLLQEYKQAPSSTRARTGAIRSCSRSGRAR